MAAFDDFIELLRLKVDIYHNAKVCGDWLIQEHEPGSTCFHVVTTGSCMLDVPGHIKTELYEGDLIIFPKEIEHKLWPVHPQEGEQVHLEYQSKRSGTGLLCGGLKVSRLHQNKLLDAMPSVLLIRSGDSTPWLKKLTKLLVSESTQYQTMQSSILNRLSELLFIYALRHYLQGSSTQASLLSLYIDPKISKALQAFHSTLSDKWSLASLAKVAGMSRTAFVKAFKEVSGWTANEYMIWWRLQSAWELLTQGYSVSAAAAEVGYLSEGAFSRAFKKEFGIGAGKVRKLSLSDS